jgi:hypothetical protein
VFTFSCTYCIRNRLVSKILSGKYCLVTTDPLKHVACRLSIFHLIFERSKSGKFDEKTSSTGRHVSQLFSVCPDEYWDNTFKGATIAS